MLRTNTDLNPLEAMLCYKQLWMVERTFRTAKHLLSTRPIFHKLDETIRGHVFCSFLALVLKKALKDRISALGRWSWPQIIADLDSLTETEIEHDGKRFVVRSAPRPTASLAIRAARRRAGRRLRKGDRRDVTGGPIMWMIYSVRRRRSPRARRCDSAAPSANLDERRSEPR